MPWEKRFGKRERFFVIKKRENTRGEAKKTRYSYFYCFYLLLLITPILITGSID